MLLNLRFGARALVSLVPLLLALGAITPAAAQTVLSEVVIPPIRYQILESGRDAQPSPRRTDTILVDYELRLITGELIDSTSTRGEPDEFTLSQLIPAWQVVLQLMHPGDKWRFFAPPAYAYGSVARGEIPANSELVFTVKLLSVRPADSK